MKVFRVLLIVVGWITLSMIVSGGVLATCYPSAPAGPVFTPPFNDSCVVNPVAGSAEGTVYYDCATYCTNVDPFTKLCISSAYGCYYHTYWCDTPSCGGASGGTVGDACDNHNDCGGGQCCKGGICSTDCTDPDPRCNPGEIFQAYVPETRDCQSAGACEMQSDGTGGEAGEVTGDICIRGGVEKIECIRGSCITPPPPCLATPPQNLTITEGSSRSVANMSWTPGTNITSQAIRVGTNLTEVNAGCQPPNNTSCIFSQGGLPITTNSFTIPGLAEDTEYHFRVAGGSSATCIFGAVEQYTAPSQPDITVTVTTTPDGSCVAGDPATWPLDIEWGDDTAVYDPSTQEYTIVASKSGTYDLIITGIPAGWVCAPCSPCVMTGPGTAVVPGVDPSDPVPNWPLYFTEAREGWWQVEGAGVYSGSSAAGINISSLVPPSQSFILPGALGDIGLLMRAAGSFDVESLGGELSSEGWSAVSRYRGRRLDYNYISARQGVTTLETSDPAWSGSDLLTEPSYTLKDFWYMEPPSGTATLNTPWNVTGGESYVIFVNGDLVIEENVLVDTSSFIAFIVNGDIVVDPAVTDLQGMYIADGLFTTRSAAPADDVQLTTGGSIVAWTGVSLGRDLGVDNVNTPAEKFVYRPDLLINMPLKMRTYALEWTEVTPGTFGD